MSGSRITDSVVRSRGPTVPDPTVTEAVDAVGTGACERHDDPPREVCGTEVDDRSHDESSEGAETWGLGTGE